MKRTKTITKNRRRRTGGFLQRFSIVYALLAMLLIVGTVSGFAWYSTRVHYIRQELSLAQLKMNVVFFDATGTPINGVNDTPKTSGNVDYLNTTTTVTNSLGGTLSYDGDHMTFYAMVQNTGTLDIDAYLQIKLNGSTGYYDNVASFIKSCVVDITSQVTGDIEAYAGSVTSYGSAYSSSVPSGNRKYYCDSLFDLENLKYIDTVEVSNARYYRIELWDEGGFPEPATSQKVDFAAMIYGKQTGQPVGEADTDKRFTVTNETEFLDALQQATTGNTIVIDKDLTINQSVVVRTPVNIIVNGADVHIRGDLDFDYSYNGERSLSLLGSATMDIDGNLLIKTQSTDFSILGDSAANTIHLGSERLGGAFLVDTVLNWQSPDQGFHLSNVSVRKYNKDNNNYNDLATLTVDSATNVIIEEGTTCGPIVAKNSNFDNSNQAAEYVYIHVYGTVQGGIDLSAMSRNDPSPAKDYPEPTTMAPNGYDQIYIYVYGTVEPFEGQAVGGNYRFNLPSWSKSWKASDTTLTTSDCNTRIYYDVHTNVKDEDTRGWVHTSGSYVDGYIETNSYSSNTVERLNEPGKTYKVNGKEYTNAYRAVITNYWFDATKYQGYATTYFIMQQLLMEYFGKNNDIVYPAGYVYSDNAIKDSIGAIDYIEVMTMPGILNGQKSYLANCLTVNDIIYLAGHMPDALADNTNNLYPLKSIIGLNLSNATTTDYSIPKNSLANSTLRYVTLPNNLKYIKEYAFSGSDIAAISIPASVETIEKNAFDVASTNKMLNMNNSEVTMKGNVFVTFERDTIPTKELMGGFYNGTTINPKAYIFLKPSVNEEFHLQYYYANGATVKDALTGVSSYDVPVEFYYRTYEPATLTDTFTYTDTEPATPVTYGLYYFTRNSSAGTELAFAIKKDDGSFASIDRNELFNAVFPEKLNNLPIRGIGDRAYANLGITSINSRVTFVDGQYTTVGAEAFKRKEAGGITFSEGIALGNITSIGDFAFYKASVKSSDARETSFAGMTYLGKYSFYGSTFGTNTDDENRSATKFGTIDVRFRSSVDTSPSDYAFAAAKFYCTTLMMKNCLEINKTVFASAVFRGCDINIDNTFRVCSNAFRGATSVSESAGGSIYSYVRTDISAIDVPYLEVGSLGSNWGQANIGLQSDARRAENKADGCAYQWGGTTSDVGFYVDQEGGPFANLKTYGTTVYVDKLWIKGDIASQTGFKGLAATVNKSKVDVGQGYYTRVNYTEVEFTSLNRDTRLPDSLFRQYTSSWSWDTCTIGKLVINNPNLTEVGKYTFCRATVGITDSEISKFKVFSEGAFYAATINTTTELNLVDSCTIGTSAFQSAAMPLVENVTIGNNSTIGTSAFQSTAFGTSLAEGTSCTITVGSGSTIASKAFNSSIMTRVSNITLTDVKSVGSYAFGEISSNSSARIDVEATGIGVIEIGGFSSEYWGTITLGLDEDDDAYIYGGSMGGDSRNCGIFRRNHAWTAKSCNVTKLVIDGLIPSKSYENALGGMSFLGRTRAANIANNILYYTAVIYGEVDLKDCTYLPNKVFGSYVTINQTSLNLAANKMTTLPTYLFYDVDFPNLTSILFTYTDPDTGTTKTASSISSYDFCSASFGNLTSLSIPNNTTLDSSAFQSANMSVATTVTIGTGSTLGTSAFQSANMSVATTVTIGTGSTLGTSAFQSANMSGATTVSIGTGCMVGESAFQSASFGASLTDTDYCAITVGSGSTVGSNAFYAANMTRASSVTVTGVISIGVNAFSKMTTTKASPPNIDATEVGIINYGAFGSEYLGIVKVGVQTDDPSYRFGGTYSNDPNAGIFTRTEWEKTANIEELRVVGMVPSASVEEVFGGFSTNDGWRADTQYSKVTIGDIDFSQCTSITNNPFGKLVTINRTSIDLYGLSYTMPSKFFRYVEFPNLTTINFQNETKTIKASSIPIYAFSGAKLPKLTSLTIPQSCVVENEAFSSAKLGTELDEGAYLTLTAESGSVIGDKAFLHSDMSRVSDITLTGAKSVGTSAFASITTTKASPPNIDATEVGIIAPTAFGTNYWGTVKVGVQTDNTAAGYKFGGAYTGYGGRDPYAGIFARYSVGSESNIGATTNVQELQVVGMIPSLSGDDAIGAYSWNNVWRANGHTNLTIGNLNLTQCTKLTARPFGHYVTINSSSLDLSNLSEVPANFLQYTSVPLLTSITVGNGKTIGNYAFADATFNMLQSVSIGNNCTVGSNLFQNSTLTSLSTVSVGANCTVGAYFMQNIKAAALSSVSFGANTTVGSHTFNAMKVNATSYRVISVSGPAALQSNAFSSITSDFGIYLQLHNIATLPNDGTCFKNSTGIYDMSFDSALTDFYGGTTISGCTYLKSVIFNRYVSGDASPISSFSALNVTLPSQTVRFYVPSAFYYYYITDPSPWEDYSAYFVPLGNEIDDWTYVILGTTTGDPTGFDVAVESYIGEDGIFTTKVINGEDKDMVSVPATLTGDDGVVYTVRQLRSTLLESGALINANVIAVPDTVTYIDPTMFESSSAFLQIEYIWIDDDNPAYKTEGKTETSSNDSANGGNYGIFLESVDGNSLYKVLPKTLNNNGVTDLTLDFENISADALKNCTSLTRVTLGSHLKSIPAGLFTYDGCNIMEWNIRSLTPPALLGDHVFGDLIYTKTVKNADNTYTVEYHGLEGYHIYVPSSKVDTYKADDGYHWYAPIISSKPMAAMMMASAAPIVAPDWSYTVLDGETNSVALDKYLGSDTDVVVPATFSVGYVTYTVTELRAGLFSGTAVESVDIAVAASSIDPAAFDDSSVASITVSDEGSDFSAVNGALLSSDGSILWRVMPAASGTLTLDGVTSVASGALKGCALENIRLGGLAAVSDNAFAGWSGTVIMPATPPTLLGSNCFGDAASLLVGSGLKAEYILLPGYSAVADRIIENSPEFAEENEEISEITPTVNSTWNYRIVNGSAVITAFLEESGIVTIPADIDGYPVAAIDPEFDAAKVVQFETESSAFAVDEVGVLYTADRSVLVRFPAASALTNYTVPSSAAVAERAFAGAKNLTTVNLYPYSLRNLGANAFADTTDELTVSGGKLTVIITARPLADGVDIETLKKLGLVFEEEPEEEITDDDDDSEAPEEEAEGTEEVTEEETPAEEPAEEASNEETPSEENPSAEEPSEEPAEQE